MAIRMGSARCGNHIAFAVQENENASGSRDGYVCRYCSTRVVFVRQQSRQYSKGTVLVGAFFRLHSSSNPHTSDCLYTIPNRLRRLADEAGGDVINKRGKVYEYRIDFLRKACGGQISAGAVESTALTELLGSSTAGSSDSFWELVRKSCKTALDLYQLHAALTSEESLAGHIRILAQGRRLEWNEFFFDYRQPSDYSRLLHILETQPNKRYAACVTGIIEGFSAETGKKAGEYIRLLTRPIANEGQWPLRINICSTQPFLKSMASANNIGKKFVACGVLQLQPHTGHPQQRNRIAYLWANDPREIAILDTAL